MKKMDVMEQYQGVSVDVAVREADPHELVVMLMDGALKNIHRAKVLMNQGEVKDKAEVISKAVAIVDSLKASLNYEAGGDLVANLEALYDYITRTLVIANSQNSIAKLDEVSALLAEIHAGWVGMAKEVKKPSRPKIHQSAVDGAKQNASALSFSA